MTNQHNLHLVITPCNYAFTANFGLPSYVILELHLGSISWKAQHHGLVHQEAVMVLMRVHSQALPMAWEDSFSIRLLYPIGVTYHPHPHTVVLACCLAFALWSLHKLRCYYHFPLLLQLRCDQTVPWQWEHYSSSAVAALSSRFTFSLAVLLLLLADTQQPLFLSKGNLS